MKDKSLAVGIRCVVYSYLDLLPLLDSISKISKQDRKAIVSSKLLSQRRSLKISIKDGMRIKYDDQFLYALKLASHFEICIHRFQDGDIFLFSTLLHMIQKEHFQKKVTLWIAIDQHINTSCFSHNLIGLDQQNMIESLTYQIQTYNHHEKMVDLLRYLDVAPRMIIDCNNYVISGVFSQFSQRNMRFPQITVTTHLVCKIVGNNFDSIVQNFPNLEELTYISQDFIQIEQNLQSLKKLRKFKIQCDSTDDQIDELKPDFSFLFHSSEDVTMQLFLDNANLDLKSILKKFSKFNVKQAEIRLNQLQINIFEDQFPQIGSAQSSQKDCFLYLNEKDQEKAGGSNLGFDFMKEVQLNSGGDSSNSPSSFMGQSYYRLDYIKMTKTDTFPFQLKYDILSQANEMNPNGSVYILAKQLNISL